MVGHRYSGIILQLLFVEVVTAVSFKFFAASPTKGASCKMENNTITFNDLPMVVAQLRDEVMSLKSLLTEQHSVKALTITLTLNLTLALALTITLTLTLTLGLALAQA